MKKLQHILIVSIGIAMIGAFTAIVALYSSQTTVTASPAAMPGIDLTTQEPFQQSVTVSLTAGEGGKNVGIDVPSGKLFVIEQVSVSGSAPSDQRIDLTLQSHISPDLGYRSHYLTAERQILNGIGYYKATHAVTIYGDTPSINARVARSTSPDTVTFRFTVSGYFVNK